MGFSRQLSVLRSSFRIVLVCVVLAAVAAAIASAVLPKRYEATATLVVARAGNTSTTDYNSILASQGLTTTYKQVATTPAVLNKVMIKQGISESYNDFLQRITVDAPRNSSLILITAADASPQKAAKIADEIANELIETSPSIIGEPSDDVQAMITEQVQVATDKIAANDAELVRLNAFATKSPAQLARIDQLETAQINLRANLATFIALLSTASKNQVTVVSPAVVPVEPVFPRPLINVGLAIVLGLALGIGIAYARAAIEDRVTTPAEVEEVAKTSMLGAIGTMPGDKASDPIYRVAALLYPRSVVAENFRSLRTNLEFGGLDDPLRSILVTSSVPGEGKTTVAVNLAIVYAQAGRKTLLVDADLRRPDVHNLLRLTNTAGLSSLLRSTDLEVAAVTQPTEQAGLRVLTTGPLPPNPAELIGSSRMRGVMERLRSEAEVIIFDSPPLNTVTDAAILATLVDGTLFVIDSHKTRKSTVGYGRDALAKVGARVVGATLNRLTARDASVYAYYEYSDGPSAAAEAPERPFAAPGGS